jgi:uncharacterized protein (DUF1330 family)
MALTLSVLLWALDGKEADLVAYEDRVLSLLPDHGGRVVQRARRLSDDGGPYEAQTLEFASQAALDGFTGDPRRAALAADRDAAISQTQISEVQLV